MTYLPYRTLWRAELRDGVNGQRPDLTATWTLDNLWAAAVLQHKAEESERMLQETLDYEHAHPDTIRHFLEQYEADCRACDEAFLAPYVEADRAA
jgi:hypothetical protein